MGSHIRYAVNGDVHIAYQVSGSGPVDLVYTPGILVEPGTHAGMAVVG